MSDDEDVLDPRITAMLQEQPALLTPLEDLSPEILALARGPVGFPVRRAIHRVTDDKVDGIPVRVYQHAGSPSGLVVYFHGGGFCIGSIGLMDNVARELAHHSGATVVSVEYRLAPEHPYPAGLDDCARVTDWAFAHGEALGAGPGRVAVAGESAGGNLATAVALRRRDEGAPPLAGQALLYPGTAGGRLFESDERFDGLVLSKTARRRYWEAYCGGRDLSREPYAAPLYARSLAGLPPALVVLGGCDMLRDEGRAYAARLRSEGVEVTEIYFPGQPHGFLNLELPAAAEAFARIGAWLREALARGATS